MASEAALPLRGPKRGTAGINAALGVPAKVGKAPARGRALNLTPQRFAEKSRPNHLFFAPLRGSKRGTAGINAALGVPTKVGKTPARGRALNLTPQRFAEKSRPNHLFFGPLPQRVARHIDFANPPP
jgi:hypothetical protein